MDLIPHLEQTHPVFLVPDIEPTMQWYQRCLGFDADPFPSSPPYLFCILRRDGVEIMLQRLQGYRKPDVYAQRPGGVWDVYVRTRNVRQFYEELSRHPDVTIVHQLHRQPYGQTEFEVRDPNGYVLVFAESVGNQR